MIDDVTPPDTRQLARFKRADALLDAALELPPAERAAFVATSTTDDPQLRADVERLLRADANTPSDFLDTPAVAFATPFLDLQPLRAGAKLGRHTLVRPLGEGGMGVVWLAHDDALDRDVALKLVRSPLRTLTADASESERARAEREARAIARLDHPHVAGIHEVGETPDGIVWFSMPYCAGGSLAERLRAGPLPVADVLRIAQQLSSALAAAHAHQVLHRDVKPANILFDASGQVRLADFGVAKLTDAETTRNSGLVGTVAYLAPEQVQGEPIDHRADLWAVGVTMYEMLTGTLPFAAPSYAAVMHAIIARPPAPLPATLELPPALATLITQLLSKSRDDRPASAAAVARALDDIIEGRASHAVRTNRRRAPRAMWMVAAALLLCVGVVAARRAWPPPSPTDTSTRGLSLASSGTKNPEAHAAFLQARYERLKRDEASMASAVRQYERAVALDPSFARAWAGLANALILQGVFGNAPMGLTLPRGRTFALRAIAMDSTIAEAYAALAQVRRVYDFDWAGSLRASERAMALDADDDSAPIQYAITLTHLRRFAEAESVITAAHRLDPANGSLYLTLGRIQLATARYDSATATLQRMVELQPKFHFGFEQLAYAHLAAGRSADALTAIRRAAVLNGARDSAHLANILAVTGARAEAQRIVSTLLASDTVRYLQPGPMAAAYAGLGDFDQAFAWLERSWRERASTLDAAAVMPALRPLHRDPRWAPFMRKLGLPVD